MADLKLIGAVAIKVRPDTTRFREETQKGIDEQLGPNGDRVNSKATVNVNADTTEAKVEITRLEDEVKGKQLTLNVGLDHDSVEKAKAQIDAALRNLDNKVIKANMDRPSLEKVRADLEELGKNAKVDFKFNQDEAGFHAVLDKIKSIRDQRDLATEWKFGVDEASLLEAEEKAKKALAEIDANKTIDIKYDKNSFDSVRDAIGQIDDQLAKNHLLTLQTKLDDASLQEARAKLLAEMNSAQVTIKFNEDKEGYETVLSRIKQLQAEKVQKEISFKTDDLSLAFARARIEELIATAPVEIKYNNDEAGYKSVLDKIAEIRNQKLINTLELKVDEESLAATEYEMRKKLAAIEDEARPNLKVQLDRYALDEAERDAKKLKDKIDDMKASMQIDDKGTAAVAAHLAFIGRDRIVTYFANVDARSVAVAEGTLKSLGGLNVLHEATGILESMFTKFDTISLKVGGLASLFGSLADVAVYAGTAIFKVGDGVLQSIGILAAAPTLVGAFASSVFVYTAAFDNFKNAFSSNAKTQAKALEALPPIARATVDSIKGLYGEIQKPVQDAFWDRMGTSLQDSIKHLIPELKTGLVSLAPSLGAFTSGVLDAFNKIALNKDLDRMFTNLKGFFDNAAKGAQPFFDAFNQFGLKGSELMPKFGQWLADLATRFDNYTSKVAANGQINDWIMHGVHSLEEMWAVGGDVIDIFKAITHAAGLAGAGGLVEFEQHLHSIGQAMLGEPWQTRAKLIFEGAREGASGVNAGLKDLAETVGKNADKFGGLLNILGHISGGVLTDLSKIFGVQKFQDGVTAAFQGMQDMVTGLGPAATAIGDLIGNLGNIAAASFGNSAGILNQMFVLVDQSFSKVADNLAAISPRLMNTVGGLFAAATPLIMLLADDLNKILDLVAMVPNTFSVAGVAVTAFFGLRALASKFFESLSGTKYFKDLEGQWLTQQVEAGKTATTYREVDGELKKMTVPTEKFSATKAIFGDLTSQVGATKQSFKDMYAIAQQGPDGLSPLHAAMKTTATMAGATLKTAIGGITDALGGPWGIAIGVASVAIGAFAQSQADAQARVANLTQELDKQTNKFSEKGIADIAAQWTDIGKAADGWANFTRNAKAANETADALHLNLEDVTKALADGGPASDDLIKKVSTLASTMATLDQATTDGAAVGLDDARKAADDAAGAFGFTTDQLEKMGIHAGDVQHLANNLQDQATAAALARAQTKLLADATGTTTIEAQEMAKAMKTIGDNSIDASQKIGAINVALDLLKGGKLSAQEGQVAAQQALQSAVASAAALKDELKGVAPALDKTTGLIDVTSSAGLKLEQAMKSSADGIKIHAQAVYDAAIKAHKTPEQAGAEAAQIVSDSQGELQKIADAAGISVDSLKTQWGSFFGSKWELIATFSATADKFEAVRKGAEASGMKWNDSIFEAFLSANPNAAQMSADQATKWAQDYANKQYEAQLKAINPDALQKILEATGQADNYKKGDYTAVMKAWNATSPGLQAALQAILNVKDGNYAAAIKAFLDELSREQTEANLAQLARTREMNIAVKYTSTNSPRPEMIDGGYDGAILKSVTDKASLLAGAFPMKPFAKFFANGGIENHVAQISYPTPSAPIRIWQEPETGGEAYIPLSAAKRSRSTEILEQVASEFGYTLTQKFANGGSTVQMDGNPRAASRPALQIQIDQFNQHANDTISDVGRGIMREARKAGVFATEAF